MNALHHGEARHSSPQAAASLRVALTQGGAGAGLSRVLSGLVAGLIAGLLTTILSISYAALVFSGDLAPHLAQGLGVALLSTALLNVVVALGSSLPFAISGSQDIVAAILASVAASVATALLRRAPAEIYPTVLAALALTAVLMGAFFLALGVLRLGRLMRFIPYPVVGGFLAGTGWLLVSGAARLMTGLPLDGGHLPLLLHGRSLAHLAPGVALAVLLLVVLRRVTHVLIMPVALLASLGLFYLALWLSGTAPARAGAQGWLLGPFPGAALWPPLPPGAIGQVNWLVLAGQSGTLATILVVSAIALLLNVSGLELATHRDADLDRELRVVGLANLLVGALGGLGGYPRMSASLVAYRAGARGRVGGLVAALVAACALMEGASVLGYLPKLLPGGLALFVGLDLLIEWLYRAWFRLPRVDYGLVLVIVGVIAVAGYLPGVLVGSALAVLLFVVAYGRVDPVKHALSGATYRSRVDRPLSHQRLLQEHGAGHYILQLQGFLFFGTASSLLERIRRRVADAAQPPVRYLVLDFRGVSGMDASALLSFAKLRDLAQAHQITVVLTGLAPQMQRHLHRAGYADAQDPAIRLYADLDQGAEWCEEQILAAAHADAIAQHPLVEQLAAGPAGCSAAARLLCYLARLQIAPGEYLIRQGAASDALYLVEAGQVTVVLERAGGGPLRLRTMGAGTIVGELGFYLGAPRSASVVAQQTCVAYRLSRSALQEMTTQEPTVATAFHELVARLLAERVVNANASVAALLQ